jgi:hypothetical protein
MLQKKRGTVDLALKKLPKRNTKHNEKHVRNHPAHKEQDHGTKRIKGRWEGEKGA